MGWGASKKIEAIPDKFSSHFSQFETGLSFLIQLFIFPIWVWSKNPKIISDQFSLHFRQFGTTLICFHFLGKKIYGGQILAKLNSGGGAEKSENNFRQFGTTLIFSYFAIPEGGLKIWKFFLREGFKKKMVGFIQRSSDPSQLGRALDKKIQKLHIFYAFIIFIITKFGENFEEKIDICFF